jgi:hypothetical protein
MKVLKFVEGKRRKTNLLIKILTSLYRSSFPKSIQFLYSFMLSFFIVELTNLNNILHGDNKDLLLLYIERWRGNIQKGIGQMAVYFCASSAVQFMDTT